MWGVSFGEALRKKSQTLLLRKAFLLGAILESEFETISFMVTREITQNLSLIN